MIVAKRKAGNFFRPVESWITKNLLRGKPYSVFGKIIVRDITPS